jgi:hypothetical protein
MSANETDLPFEFTYARKVVSRPPATEAQIAAVEARFGALPTDYKCFLQTINGGSPRAKHAPALDDLVDPEADDHGRCVVEYPKHTPFGERVYAFEVECMYGLGPPADMYEVEYYSEWPSRVLDRQVVAIAGDGAGDQLILLGPGDPAVYLWVHDEAVPPVRMASSFGELLQLIRPAVEK